jgi:Domain of unknown function (DUF3336)
MRRRGRSTRISRTDWMRTAACALEADMSELGNDLWRQNPVNNHYDYKLIHSRLQQLIEAEDAGDVQGLMYIIRAGIPMSVQLPYLEGYFAI